MKIAFFSNLEKGGASTLLDNIAKAYKDNGNSCDIYEIGDSTNIEIKKIFDNRRVYKCNFNNNIFANLFNIIFDLRIVQKKISKAIDSKRYDLVLVFPCKFTQSPYLLKYLKTPYIYIFTESKREFYEKTTFDHISPRRFLARMIRLPIKYIDLSNCKSAKNIISISEYSNSLLRNIYRKESYILYPSMKAIIPRKIKLSNNNKLLSVGLLSKIKGHDFSIKQIQKSKVYLTIIGRISYEFKFIKKILKKSKNKNVVFFQTEDNNKKNKLIRKHSIYLSNNYFEPFGLSTLEATANNRLVIGINEAGNSEIIKHGLNGFLYPRNITKSQKLLVLINGMHILYFYKLFKIDWNNTAYQIINISRKINE